MDNFGKDKVIGICGAAWGDEGKGKFTDFFAKDADIVIRAQGGNNAGHTVKTDDRELKLHVVPSGIIYEDTVNLIGNGVVVDIENFVSEELKCLKENSIDTGNLFISQNAHVVMPYHRMMDVMADYKRIGTTARGIGPCYSDKINRTGIRVLELFDDDVLREKIDFHTAVVNEVLRKEDSGNIISVMSDIYPGIREVLKENILSSELIYRKTVHFREKIRPMCVEHRNLVDSFLKKEKKILIEGAQGLLLDIDHGTYPYVTSSNSCAGGLFTGTGISPSRADRIYSISGIYLTRVGNGPFPSELGDPYKISDESGFERLSSGVCIDMMKNRESDDAEIGKAIRHLAGEFGTTTGRPRRTGWLDIPILKYCRTINGPDFIFTKFDILDSMRKIKVLKSYVYNGKDMFYNGQILRKGDIIKEFPTERQVLENLSAGEFVEYDGWMTSTRGADKKEMLPEKAINMLRELERLADIRIGFVSTGPKRNDVIKL